MLFEAEQRGLNAAALAEERRDVEGSSPQILAYSSALVAGVVEHWAAINEALSTYTQGWPLDRMPAVDRAVLRIGTFEILYADDVPDPVAISEAVGLARDLSTDESPAFVNGLLGRIATVKDTLV